MRTYNVYNAEGVLVASYYRVDQEEAKGAFRYNCPEEAAKPGWYVKPRFSLRS